jgi:serine/threonine protein kinase
MSDRFPGISDSRIGSFPRGPEIPEDAPTQLDALIFSRYRVIRELGRGGMGLVLLTHDTVLGIDVAVKVVPDIVATDLEAVADLRKEVLRGMALTHPGVVRTNHLEKDESGVGIVMEYIDGASLTELKMHQPGGCFDPEQILPWIEQICDVLDYAHREARIVHRDLKPRNIMLTKAGKIKVADFGIAAVVSDSMSRHSMEGTVSGTLNYMSPQQAQGMKPSHLDDIHALGATIYELLTGKPPFFRGNPLMIQTQVINVVPPPMIRRRGELEVTGKAGIPSQWEATVAACLAKDPADRPQSALQVLASLHQSTSPDVDPATVAAIERASPIRSGGVQPPPSRPKTDARTTPSPISRCPTAPDTRRVEAAAPSPTVSPRLRYWAASLAIAAIAVGAPAFYYTHQPKQLPLAPEATSVPSLPSTSLPDKGSPQTIATAAAEKSHVEAIPAETHQNGELADSQAEEAASEDQPKTRLKRLEDATKVQVGKAAELARRGLSKIANSTKDQPYENSLGMRFVAVPGTKVLFSIWDSRVKDYAAYSQEQTGVDPSWKNQTVQGKAICPSEDCPVVAVSWEDANAFCEWLTKKERAEEWIGKDQSYRLPTDEEWSVAVGLPKEKGTTPKEKETSGKIKRVYPWGGSYPPKVAVGNYADATAKRAFSDFPVIKDYEDGYATTSPVGSFPPNKFGLYDMGGNVWQWCQDLHDRTTNDRVLRGASWGFYDPVNLSSTTRKKDDPRNRYGSNGFRCVLMTAESSR